MPGRQPSADQIWERYRGLLERLSGAAEAAGRDPRGFRVVAVTKTFPIPVVQAAVEAGLERFGENRVQEAEPKVAAAPEAEWHMVGRMQSNKARRAVRLFAVIHSVDSVELLARLRQVAHDEGRAPNVLLELNLTGEPERAGFDPETVEGEARGEGPLVRLLADGVAPLRVVGLMAMGRFGDPPDEARRRFARLRVLRDRLAERIGRPLPELSMGMSDDAEAAVAEGATLVRIGTAIFGPRHA